MDRLELIRQRLRELGDPVALLEGLFASAPVGLQIYDSRGRSILVNQAFLDMFGSEPPPEYNVLQDEIAARSGVLGLIQRAFAGETVRIPPIWYDPRELEHVRITEGHRVAIEATFFPLLDAAQRVTHVAIVFQNVSEQQTAQEALEAARQELERRVAERTESLFAANTALSEAQHLAGIGSWDWDLTTGQVSWSPELYRIYGLDPASFVPTRDAAIERVHPEDRRRIREQVDRAVRDGVALNYEYRIVRPNGEIRSICVAGRVIADDQGHPVRVIGTIQDITDRKAADEERVRWREERAARAAAERGEADQRFLAEAGRRLASSLEYEATLRSVMDLALPRLGDFGFFDVLEADGMARRIAGAHEDPRRLHLLEGTQWVRSDRTDVNLCALSTGIPALHPSIDDAWLQNVATGPEHLAVLRDLAFASMITVPLVYQARRLGALTLFHTVESGQRHGPSELVLAEELALRAASALENARLYRDLRASEETAQRAVAEANEADRRKDEFLAMLGHELRNPLAPISTAAHVLHLREGDRVSREVRVIERQVAHLARLLEDLLDVSRVTRGKIDLRREPLYIGDVLQEAVDLAHSQAQARRLELVLDVTDPSLAVLGDRVRLTQVLSNVIGNSVKFTPPSGRIAVSCRADGDEVVIDVRDTGDGIPEAMLSRIFDPFVQGEQSLERSQGGLGLGLAIVKNLVELHGGTVSARSEGAGRGSLFTIRLARSTPPADVPVRRATGRLTSAACTRRVLVVDDNADAAEMLAHALRLHGHEALVAHDGPSALEAARRFQPEMAFVDIGLPGMDGLEVAKHLRQERGDSVRLVAISGYGQAEDLSRSRDVGFDEHLVKPVDMMRVQRVVDTLADRPPDGHARP